MCPAQAEVHDLLRRQYGLRAAGRFMPHATIKGFSRSEVPVAEMVSRLNGTLASRRPFAVHNGGVIEFGGTAIVFTIQHGPDGGANAPLRDLHEAVLAALAPRVHPDCEFTKRE